MKKSFTLITFNFLLGIVISSFNTLNAQTGTNSYSKSISTVSKQISQASDDIEEWLAPKSGETQSKTVGAIDYNSSDLELGYENTTQDPQMVGLRFANITIEKGAPIISAYLKFEVDAISKNSDTCALYIWAEDTDSASTFNATENYTAYELTSRAKLDDSVQWVISKDSFIVVDKRYNSVDISSLVLKLISRDGWKSGNAMAFYIAGSGTREMEAYDGESASAPILVINRYITTEDSVKQAYIKTIISNADTLTESCYTVPSWTLLKKAYVTATANLDEASATELNNAISALQPKAMPYNVVMSINGDPATRMGFAWFTNYGVTGGKVQIVEGTTNDSTKFRSPAFTFNAKCDTAANLNYCVSANGLASLAGISNNTKKSYISNKALAKGLSSGTCYSFRVGQDTLWSEIGHFTTAVPGNDNFTLIYSTDPQAQTESMFDISQTTTHVAYSMFPNANFWLNCGDLIETSGSTNSEWEYEQFFETQQDIWLNNALVAIGGNHDKSSNKNITYHFNTSVTSFDSANATCPGSVYSFVYGNALFMALNFEDYSIQGYLDSLVLWMDKQVKANPDVKWRVTFSHRPLYTGSSSHAFDSDLKTIREKMAPVYDSLKIDLALQGHDHVYEVIGPVHGKSVITNVVSDQSVVTRDSKLNVKGLLGGTFNVDNGTLYFLNNSAGEKKYYPSDSTTMKSKESTTGVTDYFTLFTGRFGQNGDPTFSYLNVKADSIIITTYSIDDNGDASVFDKFAIVKSDNSVTGTSVLSSTSVKIWPNPASDVLNVTNLANEKIDIKIYSSNGMLVKNISGSSVSQINIDDLKNGLYILKLTTSKETLSTKFVKE